MSRWNNSDHGFWLMGIRAFIPHEKQKKIFLTLMEKNALFRNFACITEVAGEGVLHMKNKNIFSCWLSIPFHWFFLFSFNWPKINFSNFRRVGNKYIPRHFSLKTWIDKISHYPPEFVVDQDFECTTIEIWDGPQPKNWPGSSFFVVIEVAISYKVVPSFFSGFFVFPMFYLQKS